METAAPISHGWPPPGNRAVLLPVCRVCGAPGPLILWATMRWLPLLLLPLLPALWGFTPFTAVRNVCPACPRPKTDLVKLTSGQTVTCTVMAQNDDYYV